MRDLTLRTRPSKDVVWLTIALGLACRATCIRRQVGCVLVDANGDVLSTGYNGPPRGWAHCIEHPCAGAHAEPGEGLSACEAVHAEANALIQCRSPYAIHTAYCTDSPCLDCVKLLLNTSCQRIVFLREYPHPASQARWKRGVNGFLREWLHHPQATEILSGAFGP